MHKDANLRKRNALVIPGGLLAVYSLAGMAYVTMLRTGGSCGDPSLMVFAGACRSAVLVMGIPFVIGLAIALVGAIAFRGKATCRHGHGSWTHFGLAFLISLVVVPALGVGLAPSLVGDDAAITRGGVDYPVSSILGGLSVLGVLMLVPFAFLYAGQVRANPCCREKSCFSPCFCDEAPAGEELPEGPVEETTVTGGAPPPPASPADDWQVVPETPPAPTPAPTPAPEPEPMPEPSPEPEKPAKTATASATTLAGAPPLASRPTDPAAPPSDEMAHAVEWAEDDSEDEDGEDEEEAAAAKPARRRKAASKPAKASKKKTAKSKK